MVEKKNIKQIIRDELRKEINERSFFEFVKWAAVIIEPGTKWKWNFHHEFLCNILQKETIRIKGGIKRDKHIIINVPFRSSKSLIVSILYPIWSWSIHTTMGFINLSYSDNLSTDHSNKVYSLINHPKFKEIYNFEFDNVQFSKTDFKLKSGGSRLSGGVGGTVLGRGGDVIIMDDPNNSRRLSEVERKNTIKSWTDTISTRLNDPDIGLFIVIQQRLHQNDLTGYLLENDNDNWNHINLPAEINNKNLNSVKPQELINKYVDGLLWHDRFSRKVLDNFKVTLGSVGYSNQLLQSPTPDEGVIIKRDWIPIITYEKFMELFSISQNNLTGGIRRQLPIWDMFIDSAQTEKKKNDPSGILIGTSINNIVYVRKVIEKRFEFPDLVKFLELTYNTYSSHGKGKIYVEPKSNGKDIISYLKKNSLLNVVELTSPKDDKETRLNAVSPIIESGRFILIEDNSNDLIIDQLTQFPNASHDEFVDLTAYSINKYLTKSTGKFNYSMT